MIIPIARTALRTATDNGHSTVSDQSGTVPEGTARATARISDTVNDTVKQRLVQIVSLLYRHPGLRKGQLLKELGSSEITLKRDIQKLRGMVEFRGSQKTGGYFLTNTMEHRIKA